MSVSFLDKENVQLGPVRLCLHPIKLIRFEGNTTPIPHGHKRGVDKGGHEEKFLELPSVRARTKEALIGANGSWMPRNGLRSVAMMQPLVPSPSLDDETPKRDSGPSICAWRFFQASGYIEDKLHIF
ncbi:hypothetical protein KEM48_008559 [Puccinia striiformis f. sp. tritici PST-130]|nr:hypothetical protein KEM48_008559 [Puccinia striiformis f. sp. tritici PST-130]